MIQARLATLDDWQGLKDLWYSFQKTRFTSYIDASLEDLGHYLTNSLSCPERVGLLVLENEGKIVGIITLCAMVNPQLHLPGCPLLVNGFIHVAYITPGQPHRAGIILSNAINDWCKARHCKHVIGHVRMDGNFEGFFKKYGFKQWHYVIGREVDHG